MTFRKKDDMPPQYSQEEIDAFDRAHPGEMFTPPPAANAKPAEEKKAEQKPKEPPQAPEEPKLSNYEYIELELRRKESTGRLSLALGFDGKDDAGKAEAFKYISSVLQEIKKTECEPGEKDPRKINKDLTLCTSDSIIRAIIDAATFRLPIDGRKLAFIVRYNNEATFQPGYKGFLYKISELCRDTDFTARAVFKGDKFTMKDSGGYQTYELEPANPFETNIDEMVGLVACLSYTDSSGRRSKVATLPKSEIDKIRKAAKQDYIWEKWYFERANSAALKRLCKTNFAASMGLQQLIAYDNEKHYIDATPNGDRLTPAASGKELSNLLEHKPEPVMKMAPVATPTAEKAPVTNEKDNANG